MKFLYKTIYGIIIFWSASLFGQGNNPNQSGIYLTSSDFESNKLSYMIICDSSSHKINTHEILEKSHLDIYHEGQKYTLNKNEVYGFRLCNDQTFRFYNNKELLIKEKNRIYIYVTKVSIPSGKKIETKDEYYFSVGATNNVIELNINNLKRAFPDNHKFHDLLDSFFKDETDIAIYDTYHKIHKINHLLEQSLK
jgi:hypothetical protein